MSACVRRLPALSLLALILPACSSGGSGTLNPTIAPGVPANVTARAGNRSTKLTWTPSAVGSDHTVLRSLNPQGPFFPVSIPGQSLTPSSYDDTGLLNGTTYYYQVMESNHFGMSPPSAVVSATPDFKALHLAAKFGDLLALLRDGSVWHWGHGLPVPVQVDMLPEITAIASGSHTLALAADGKIWGWGPNNLGQLGPDVSSFGTTIPVLIPGITDAIAIAAGSGTSMAITHDGRVMVWGSNFYGEFGQGTTVPTHSPVPQEIPGLTGIIAVSAGDAHCMALRSDGLVYSWGTNQFGPLGYPPISSSPTAPTLIPDLNGVVTIAAGANHSLVLRDDGSVWAWGYNIAGMVGDGTTNTPVIKPFKVLNLSGIVAIAAGPGHSAAVRNDGTVWTWGSNISGQIGNGTDGITPVTTAIQVSGITNAVAIEASSDNTFALGSDGTVYAWGDNQTGGLGIGKGGLSPIPVELVNFNTVAQAVGGEDFTLVRKTDGSVWGYGTNTAGQVGDGTYSDTDPVFTPVQTALPGGSTAVSIAAGLYHGLALLSTGEVYGWGWNDLGPVGDGTSADYYLSPVLLPALANVTTIAAGHQNSLAIRNDVSHPRTVYAWGDNTWGQLGNGSLGGIGPTPTEVAGLTDVVALAVGERHSLAVKSDGTVWGWGDNNYNQLGQGPSGPTSALAPIQVPGLSGVVAVGAGQVFSMALCQDGTVWGWGVNASGELGVPSINGSDVPIQVPGVSGAIGLSCGFEFTAALLGDGTVLDWGNGGTFHNSSVLPVPQLSGVVSISCGRSHGLARLSNGTVHGWGTNGYGELGVAPLRISSVPVIITR